MAVPQKNIPVTNETSKEQIGPDLMFIGVLLEDEFNYLKDEKNSSKNLSKNLFYHSYIGNSSYWG